MVESQPSKLLVAGSIPVSRSNLRPLALARHRANDAGLRLATPTSRSIEDRRGRKAVHGSSPPRGRANVDEDFECDRADVAQLAEHVLGKDEVTGSIPVIGSNLRPAPGSGELRLASQSAGFPCRAT